MHGPEFDSLMLKLALSIGGFVFCLLIMVIGFFIKNLISAINNLEKAVGKLDSHLAVLKEKIKHNEADISENKRAINSMRKIRPNNMESINLNGV